MSEYVVFYHNADDGTIWVRIGDVCKGIRSARKLAYETYHKLVADNFADAIEVKIETYSGYTIETLNNFTVNGEEIA